MLGEIQSAGEETISFYNCVEFLFINYGCTASSIELINFKNIFVAFTTSVYIERILKKCKMSEQISIQVMQALYMWYTFFNEE